MNQEPQVITKLAALPGMSMGELRQQWRELY